VRVKIFTMVYPRILPRNFFFVFSIGILVFVIYVYFGQKLLSIQNARKEIQSEISIELNEKIFYPLCQLKLTPETIENSDFEKYFVPLSVYHKVGIMFSDDNYISSTMQIYDIIFRDYEFSQDVDYNDDINCDDFTLNGSKKAIAIEKFDLKGLTPYYSNSFVYRVRYNDSKVVTVMFAQDSDGRYLIENASFTITNTIKK